MAQTNKFADSTLRTLRRSVWLVSLPFFILGLLLPIYGREIGASVVEIGLFFAVFSLMTVLLRPFVGWGLDRFGRRPFYLLGVAGYALTWVAFAFIDQTWGIVAARTIQGVASSFLWLAANATVADVAGEARRAHAFGGIAQASSQGSIVGAFVAMTLINMGLRTGGQGETGGNWRAIFLIYAVAGVIALALAWRFLPETNPAGVSGRGRRGRGWVLLLLGTGVARGAWSRPSSSSSCKTR